MPSSRPRWASSSLLSRCVHQKCGKRGPLTAALQAAFELIAARYPDAFAGYEMSVTESHQSSKVSGCLARVALRCAKARRARRTVAQADTSGTAKALVASFQKLGPKFEVDEIVKVRDAEHQREMGVPGA